MTPRPQLIIMVKKPQPGRVKTRLAHDIGRVEATWWYRHQTARLIRNVARDTRWQTILAVAPDTSLHERCWPRHLPRWRQGSGNLGDRMAALLGKAAPGPVLLIGSDIPDVDTGKIATAFTDLRRHDVVFGPATDGGYWLIGLRSAALARGPILQNIHWSSANTLTDSISSFGSNMRIAQTTTLQDVDQAQDMSRVKTPGFPGCAF